MHVFSVFVFYHLPTDCSWVAEPLGVLGQVADKSCSVPTYQTRLWEVYHKNRAPGEEEVVTILLINNDQAMFLTPPCMQEASLAQEIGWTPYHVHRWFWRARNCHKPSILTKFKEGWSVHVPPHDHIRCVDVVFPLCSWRFLFYLSSFLFGAVVLVQVYTYTSTVTHSLILLPHSNTLQEPFFWNIEKCYEGYPHNVSLSYTILYYNATVVISVLSTLQPPSSLVLAYWALQLAFYSSLIVSVFRDVRRKVSTVCVHVKHVLTC